MTRLRCSKAFSLIELLVVISIIGIVLSIAVLSLGILGDERAGIQGFDLATLCGCNEISFQPPRWYGISLKRSF